MSLTLADLKEQGLIIFECLSGSRAYGLDTPESDTDVKGIFILPEDLFYGFDYTDQVASEKNDIVYYELKKYLQLLAKNNPAAIELLFAPSDTVRVRDPLMDIIDPSIVVSKMCRDSFAGYALSQVRRAKGLNKKIFNPKTGEVPQAIDFCYVLDGERTMPVATWLEREGLDANVCGLSALPHVRDGYALFHVRDANEAVAFAGLFRSDHRSPDAPASHDVCLSSIPKGMQPRTWLFFNRDDYSRQHREYHEYKTWEAARNNERYLSTLEHGGGYDAKNMMHTIRLIRMAGEIARTGKPEVRRRDRDVLLSIKRGMYGYEELLDMAQEEIKRIDVEFASSLLRTTPDVAAIESWTVRIRKEWYRRCSIGCR
jgi:uncharacterized protein